MTPTQTQATVVIDRSVKSLQKTLADIIKSTGNLQLKELAARVEESRRTRLEVAKADANKQGVTVNTGK